MVRAQVKEFHKSGAHLVTPERWYIGTIFRLTLEYEVDENGEKETHAVTIDCKAARHEADGLAVEFLIAGPNACKALLRFFELVRRREKSRPQAA
jgi:hypothetical protein